jgi:hypothetical protein
MKSPYAKFTKFVTLTCSDTAVAASAMTAAVTRPNPIALKSVLMFVPHNMVRDGDRTVPRIRIATSEILIR